MSKYILRADTKEGPVYYMNVICISEQKECAETFSNKKDAEASAEHFKRMFHYEEPIIVIEETL